MPGRLTQLSRKLEVDVRVDYEFARLGEAYGAFTRRSQPYGVPKLASTPPLFPRNTLIGVRVVPIREVATPILLVESSCVLVAFGEHLEDDCVLLRSTHDLNVVEDV